MAQAFGAMNNSALLSLPGFNPSDENRNNTTPTIETLLVQELREQFEEGDREQD